jgi:hypothetical protein
MLLDFTARGMIIIKNSMATETINMWLLISTCRPQIENVKAAAGSTGSRGLNSAKTAV